MITLITQNVDTIKGPSFTKGEGIQDIAYPHSISMLL